MDWGRDTELGQEKTRILRPQETLRVISDQGNRIGHSERLPRTRTALTEKKKKKGTVTSPGKDVGKLEPSHTAGVTQRGRATVQTVCLPRAVQSTEFPSKPSLSPSGYTPLQHQSQVPTRTLRQERAQQLS